MAFNAGTQWEVRTTGSDTNGGGFNITSTGTDFSQQDAAQVAFTDLVIGATTTQLTSVAHPFVAADVGNVINIVSGTGFTVQRVQVVSVSGVTATCDKACGTAASIGGSGNLGGGLATPTVAFPLIVAQNTVWIKAGTYNLSALLTVPAVASSAVYIFGYATTHGDDGTPPVLNMTANSTQLMSVGSSGSLFVMHNISFTSTATTKADCIHNGNTGNILALSRLSIVGFVIGLGGQGGIVGTTPSAMNLTDCSITGCSSNAISFASPLTLNSCYINGNIGVQIVSSTSSAILVATNSLITNGGSDGVELQGADSVIRIQNCTIAFNAGAGVHISAGNQNTFLLVQSSIVYGNGGWGVRIDTAITYASISYTAQNAYGANTSGNRDHVNAGIGDVTLTANPFIGSPNFALNAVAGGGASCKGLGYPGLFPGGTTTGVMDIGAAQSGAGAVAPVSNFGYVG